MINMYSVSRNYRADADAIIFMSVAEKSRWLVYAIYTKVSRVQLYKLILRPIKLILH